MDELRQFMNVPLAMELQAANRMISSFAIANEDRSMQAAYRESKERLEAAYCMIDGERAELDTLAAVGKSHRGITAVVPLFGPLSTHGGWFSQSTKAYASMIAKLDANEAVGTIITHINSPGGTVHGTVEAASALRAVRERGATDTVSVVDPQMASAATWIGAAAREVVVTPSGEAGSIGVIAVYVDRSQALEAMGIKVDVMRSPDKKARFTGVEPMTDEMREHVDGRIAIDYQSFVADMAKNRGVSKQSVIDRFGGGEMLSATEAKEAGLVDRIATLEEVLATGGKKTAGDGGRRRRANENRLKLSAHST